MPAVSISGTALVSVMGQLAAPGGDKEGLLFGVVRQERSRLQDDPTGGGRERPSGSEEDGIEIEIQSYVQCTGGAQPWTADEARLAALVADATDATSQSLLGWASARRNCPLRPSLRDCAMVSSLASWRDAHSRGSGESARLLEQCGILLGRFGSSIDHGHNPSGAVHSFDSRFYATRVPHQRGFSAVRVDVRNIGRTNKGEYDELALSPSFGLVGGEPACAPLWDAVAKKKASAMPAGTPGAMCVEAMAPESVTAMEALTTASIGQVETLANEVVAMETRAAGLRQAIAQHRQHHLV